MSLLKAVFCAFLLVLGGAAIAAEQENVIANEGEIASVVEADLQEGGPLPFAKLPPKMSESIESQGCCKYCSQGQPCGNTCISRDSTCRSGKGCAC